VDNDGTVSAKNVYKFLELDPTNYSRWCKTKILNNSFAEESVDFNPFVINDECGGQSTTDYKLTISFAKKLCMQQGNERGEEARNYFIKVEEKLKQIAKGEAIPKLPKATDKSLEIKEKNARVRTASLYLKIANNKVLPEAYRQIFLSYAGKELSGQEILPLPKSEQKTYSATEIGKIFGVSSQKIGRIANANNLKTDEYGMLYHDKARHSVKELDTFRYFDTAIPKFEELLIKKAVL